MKKKRNKTLKKGKENKFVECLNCGRIHCVLDKEMAENFKNNSDEEFSPRDLTRCCDCGAKDSFSIVSNVYVDYFSSSDKIKYVFLDYGELKKRTKG